MTRSAILVVDHNTTRYDTIEAAIRRLRPDMTVYQAMLAGDAVVTAHELTQAGEPLVGTLIHSSVVFGPVTSDAAACPTHLYVDGAVVTAQMLHHTVELPLELLVGLAYDQIAECRLGYSRAFGEVVFDDIFSGDPDEPNAALKSLLGRLTAARAKIGTTAAAVT